MEKQSKRSMKRKEREEREKFDLWMLLAQIIYATNYICESMEHPRFSRWHQDRTLEVLPMVDGIIYDANSELLQLWKMNRVVLVVANLFQWVVHDFDNWDGMPRIFTDIAIPRKNVLELMTNPVPYFCAILPLHLYGESAVKMNDSPRYHGLFRRIEFYEQFEMKIGRNRHQQEFGDTSVYVRKGNMEIGDEVARDWEGLDEVFDSVSAWGQEFDHVTEDLISTMDGLMFERLAKIPWQSDRERIKEYITSLLELRHPSRIYLTLPEQHEIVEEAMQDDFGEIFLETLSEIQCTAFGLPDVSPEFRPIIDAPAPVVVMYEDFDDFDGFEYNARERHDDDEDDQNPHLMG